TPQWYVEGFLAAGVITELDGKLKASGKTTFAGRLTKAVLEHAPFLGRPTRQTPVLWLTEERAPTFLQALKRADLETRTDLHLLHWHDVRAVPWPRIMQAATAHALTVGAGM